MIAFTTKVSSRRPMGEASDTARWPRERQLPWRQGCKPQGRNRAGSVHDNPTAQKRGDAGNSLNAHYVKSRRAARSRQRGKVPPSASLPELPAIMMVVVTVAVVMMAVASVVSRRSHRGKGDSRRQQQRGENFLHHFSLLRNVSSPLCGLPTYSILGQQI